MRPAGLPNHSGVRSYSRRPAVPEARSRPRARRLALALTLTLLALDAVAAVSLALPAWHGTRLAAAAVNAPHPVPELPVELQSLPNTCGPAAVATLATWLGTPVAEAAVLRRANLTASGISLAEFTRLAALHGVEGAWYQVGASVLHGLQAPYAIHVTRAGRGHFLLVSEVRGGLALVADPATGGAVVPLKSLLAEFEGRVFVLARGSA